jgi:ketosteroid isomerase-like protein
MILGTTTAFTAEPATQPTITLPPELARILADYESAWQARDAKALAALFTTDGFVLSSGRAPVRGRENIEQRYQNSGGPLALRAFAYETDGAVGYIIGGFGGQPGKPDVGKFTLTLRKGADGVWLIVSDMDNGNGSN